MSKVTSIMIVGVGGQGTLLASRIIGNMLLSQGFDVKLSEIHGMAQRGGSVVTYVRFGESVSSPIIDEGGADFIVSFEQLEAYRWLPYLKNDGTIIVNTQVIKPMPVITGKKEYPNDVISLIKEQVKNVFPVDALKLALECGNAKAANVVLLGVLAKCMQFEKAVWVNALEETVPKKLIDINMKAFEAGYTI